MKQLGALLLPLNGILVHHRVPSMKQLEALLLPPEWDAAGPSQGTQHEATRSITTPPGWDAAGPSQGTQHELTRSITTPPWLGC